MRSKYLYSFWVGDLRIASRLGSTSLRPNSFSSPRMISSPRSKSFESEIVLPSKPMRAATIWIS